MDVARLGIRLARQAVRRAGARRRARSRSASTATSTADEALDAGSSPRVLEEEPPDLRPPGDDVPDPRALHRPGVERASRPGCLCGCPSAAAATASAASTASTGAGRRATSSAAPPHASRRRGVRALLINCLPPDHVPGMLPWLRDFVDLPLGVYPNLGYYSDTGWRFDDAHRPGGVRGAGARLARRGRADRRGLLRDLAGAHRSGAAKRLAGTWPGRPRSAPPPEPSESRAALHATPWVDEDGRRRSTRCRFPSSSASRSVFVPTLGSLLVVEALLARAARRGQAVPGRRLRHRPARRPARARTARSTSTPSTSSGARSPTRSRTRFATASPSA